MTREETAFMLRRAEQEVVQALLSLQPHAAAVHQRLAELYSARAVKSLAEEGERDQPSG